METEPTRQTRNDLPSGVVTFVFTDIESSTRLLRELGPDFTEALELHNDIIRSAVARNDGMTLRSEGDALFSVFRDPANAVAACLEAQLALAGAQWPRGAELRVRIGMHTGPIELGGADYVGLAIHQAARVAAAPHGGQTVVSEATRQLVGNRLPDGASFTRLGTYRLKDFPEPTVIHQLEHPGLLSGFPALRALPAAIHNLPDQATVFVGRQTALEELSGLVRAHRIVSVLGAGGVGKTRLTAETVPLLVDAFPDGIWVVELGKLRRGQAVAAELAALFGVREEAGRDIEATLIEALAGRALLLVLDNCEHLLDDVAALVQRLRTSCRQLHVLTTSREPLALPGERRYPLAPLSLPGDHGSSSEAVALFVDRAKVVAPGLDLEQQRDAVVEICRRLDGLPLAIELAAARAAAIPPNRMASRLDHRFSVLRRSHRGALPHHATLRASIEWSYELLEDDERLLLARLSAFSGRFALEAAEDVCSLDPLDADEILDLLGQLIEKSLLQATGERYLMLESIREFARERLAESGGVDEVIARHINHYAALAEEAAEEAEGPGQREAFDRIDAELSNVRTAIERALERSDQCALRLSAALGQYGFVRNRLGEVARWCIDAAAISDAPAGLRARALSQAGFGLVVMGSPDGGQALLDDALELARDEGEELLRAQLLIMAADLRLEVGRDADARPLAAQAIELVDGLGDDLLRGRAMALLARADVDEVGYDETVTRFENALEALERAGDSRQVGRLFLTRAYLHLEAGRLDAAEADARLCLAVNEELAHPIGDAMSRLVFVWVAIDRGEIERAAEQLERCLAVARSSGYRALVGYCVAADAALRTARGDAGGAALRLGALGLEANGPGPVLGGEGSRAIGARLSAVRERLAETLGPEALAREMRSGVRAELEGLAAQSPGAER